MSKPRVPKIDPATVRKVVQYTSLELSILPPSVNKAYVNSKEDGQKGRFKSSAYKAWEKAAGTELEAQHPGYVAGPYALTVRFGRVNKQADLGNLEKPLSDLLVKHYVVKDDSLAQKIVLEWGTSPGVHIMVVSTKEVGE